MRTVFSPLNPSAPEYAPTGEPPPEAISYRERQLLNGLAQGQTNQEIADYLGLRVGTVKAYMRTLRHKAGCRNRVELLLWWQEHGAEFPE